MITRFLREYDVPIPADPPITEIEAQTAIAMGAALGAFTTIAIIGEAFHTYLSFEVAAAMMGAVSQTVGGAAGGFAVTGIVVGTIAFTLVGLAALGFLSLVVAPAFAKVVAEHITARSGGVEAAMSGSGGGGWIDTPGAGLAPPAPVGFEGGHLGLDLSSPGVGSSPDPGLGIGPPGSDVGGSPSDGSDGAGAPSGPSGDDGGVSAYLVIDPGDLGVSQVPYRPSWWLVAGFLPWLAWRIRR